MILDLKNIIHFGKHKGYTIEDVIVLDPTYIDWLIGEVSAIEIPPDFIENAVKLNPNFSISEENLVILERKILNYNNTQGLQNNFSANYIKWLNLTDDEKKIYEAEYEKKYNLVLDKVIEIGLSKIQQSNNIVKNKLSPINYHEVYIEGIPDSKNDEISWKNYDENLGFGEQSDEFWNQF